MSFWRGSGAKFASRVDRLYAWIPRPGWAWIGLAAATLVVAAALFVLGRPLATETTPDGILNLELARSPDEVSAVIGAWGKERLVAAILQTWADFLFLVLYPLELSLGCWLLARSLPQGSMASLGRAVAALVLLAGPLDAAENFLMLSMIHGDIASWMPIWTSRFATVKFALALGVAPTYLAVAGLTWLRFRNLPKMALNQVTLPATDLTRSVEFYERLGLRLIVDSVPRYARFECPDGGSTLSLHHVESVPPEHGVTVYFESAGLDAKVKHLRAAGLDVEDPVDQSWNWRETRVEDPDGNVICLYWAGQDRRFPPWRV